ncbi:MAG: CAP domain-containing protein [Silicimonas sp.]|nr:CAP domain-containing protein [Silicimonas sp.]
MPRFAGCLAAIALTCAAVSSAQACSRNVPVNAARTIVPAGPINQALLDKAVRVEVNYHRCRAGLRPLQPAGPTLVKQARRHSQWMARRQKLAHVSGVRGASTLKERVRSAGIRATYGAENIGMIHRYRIDDKRIKIVSAGRCQFATRSGQILPSHTYASLARYSVQRWMNSPGHRKNILNRDVSRVSTAASFDPKARYCGLFWMTQNFVG